VVVQHPEYPTRRRLYDTLPRASEALARLDEVEGLEVAAPRLMGFGLVGGRRSSAGGQLVGVLPERESRVTGIDQRLSSGQWLASEPSHKAVIGVRLAEELQLAVGDELVVMTQSADGSLGNALFTVSGVFRSGQTALDRSGVMVHLADLQELLVLPDQVHRITLIGDDPEAIATLAERARAVSPPDEPPELVQTWWEASPSTQKMLETSEATKGIVLGIVFAVATFGVVNTMTMSVFERTRELGVLRAIGLRPARLVTLVVLESLQLSLLAMAGALALGGALDAWLVVYGIDFSGSMEEGFSFAGVTIDPVMRGLVRPDGVGLTLGSILLVGVLASIWPAARAARLRPVEALRAE
jgi:ABC-type lipoprotein release transport system permease subunit